MNKEGIKKAVEACGLAATRGFIEGTCIGSTMVVGVAYIATKHYVKGAICIGAAIALGIETSTHYIETKTNELCEEASNLFTLED